MLSRRALPSLNDLSRSVLRTGLAILSRQKRLDGLFLVDATCGNGHDTLFLADTLAGLGARCPILAFDIQPEAIARSRQRLGPHGGGVIFYERGHETLAEVLAEYAPKPRLAAVVYNLGFLPGSDRRVTTTAERSMASLAAAAAALAGGGLMSVHAYGGHPGGSEELEAASDWFGALPARQWTTAGYALRNKEKNPETLFLAEKTADI